MVHHRLRPANRRAASLSWRAGLLVLAVLLLTFAPTSHEAAAKAPPLATTVVSATIYAAPDVFSPELGLLAPDTQLELTGEAAPGFLAVYYAGGVGWVPAQFLALSDRPGIDTAVALVDTALLEAPTPEADPVAAVPEGAALILTGATVGGYDAASYDGSGGWVSGRDIAQ